MHSPASGTLCPSSESFNLLGGIFIEPYRKTEVHSSGIDMGWSLRHDLLEIISPEKTLSPLCESLIGLTKSKFLIRYNA